MMEYGYITRKGKARQNNQDNIYAAGFFLPEKHGDVGPFSATFDFDHGKKEKKAFCIFDGMGGEQAGETASWLAASHYQHYDELLSESGENILPEEINEAVNDTVASQFSENNEKCQSRFERIENTWKLCISMGKEIDGYAKKEKLMRMGSTVAGIIFWEDLCLGYNVGDSRIYQLSGNQMKQVSRDHCPSSFLSKKGGLTQFLGIPEEEFIISPDIFSVKNSEKDTFLLCSDGISDVLAPSELKELLKQGEDMQTTLLNIMNRAMEKGTMDDASIVIVRPVCQDLKK